MRLLRLYLNFVPGFLTGVPGGACQHSLSCESLRQRPLRRVHALAAIPGADLIDSAAAAHPRAKSIAVAAESAPSVIFRAIVRT